MRRFLLVPAFIAGFVVLGVLSGYLTFTVMSFSKTVEVPDLHGKTVVEANGLLSKGGLNLKVEGEEFDASVPSGRIVRQDIPAGNKVKERRGIKVFLSKGPRFQTVPDLVGQTLAEAEALLARSGIRIDRVIRVHSTAIEKDRVIGQRPGSDERIRETLSLIVSSGPYDIIYLCPDLTGKGREEAASLAEKLGLRVETSGQGDRVKSQKPKPNTIIRSGETIQLQLEGETGTHG